MFKRNTACSEKVFAILKSSCRPMNINSILGQLAEYGLHPNKTTLYRILNKCLASQTVVAISTKKAVTYFEWVGDNHSHFSCNVCDMVVCLNDTKTIHALDFSSALPSKTFKVTSYDVHLHGICDPCQQKAEGAKASTP